MDASHQLYRAAARLAERRAVRLPEGRDMVATVSTVVLNAASDGGAIVTVTYRGEELTVAAYVTPHVPVVGQRSYLRLVDNQLILIGRLGGFPPEQ